MAVTTSCRFMGTEHWCPKIMWNIFIGFVLLPSLKVVVSVRILFLYKSASWAFIYLIIYWYTCTLVSYLTLECTRRATSWIKLIDQVKVSTITWSNANWTSDIHADVSETIALSSTSWANDVQFVNIEWAVQIEISRN